MPDIHHGGGNSLSISVYVVLSDLKVQNLTKSTVDGGKDEKQEAEPTDSEPGVRPVSPLFHHHTLPMSPT